MKIDRGTIYAKFAGRCAYCGEDIRIKDMQIDHIKPKIYDGSDEEDNLNPACRVCNNFKLVFSIEEFRANLESQVEKLRRVSGQFRRAERYGLVEAKEPKVIFYFERVLKEKGEGE